MKSVWVGALLAAGVNLTAPAAVALCTGSGPCNDLRLVAADGRNELGTFSGGGGACYAYEHRGFDGDRLALGKRRKFDYVGSDFSDDISSFRVAPGCVVVAWDPAGAETTFRSDTEYVGDTWNDDISGFACRCR